MPRACLRRGNAILCVVVKPCKYCGDAGTLLCDWKLTGTKAGKTCDAQCCARCATHVGPDKDLCPPHARLWATHPANPANARTS